MIAGTIPPQSRHRLQQGTPIGESQAALQHGILVDISAR
jgi:hypothetical protein